MDNLIETIESQYANSPRLMALIDSYNDSVDPSDLFDDFYENVWDVLTAQHEGLDIWGRIVVVDRIVTIITDKKYFRWNETYPDSTPWSTQPWYRNKSYSTDNYYLTDSAFRLTILVKAMANISDGTIKTYNRMLMTLFPNRGNVYVVDNFDMSITIVFKFKILAYEEALITRSGVFPLPCGQRLTVVLDDGTEMLYTTEMLDDTVMK